MAPPTKKRTRRLPLALLGLALISILWFVGNDFNGGQTTTTAATKAASASHKRRGGGGTGEMKRVFLVGSGHSGTSVLLRTVGNLPGLHCQPLESYIFERVNNTKLIQAKFQEWDKKAAKHNYVGWVEKTPLHIYYLKEIFEFSPKARVINIFRDGRDAIASFHKRGYSIESAIEKWVSSAQAILPYANDERVLTIKFEDFVDPNNVLRVLQKMCDHMGTPGSVERLLLALQPATTPLKVQQKCTQYDSEEDKIKDLAASSIMHLARPCDSGPEKPEMQKHQVGILRAWQVSQAWAPVASRWETELTDEQKAFLAKNETFRELMAAFDYDMA